jgi:deoxycytidine triphosphate deaminase
MILTGREIVRVRERGEIVIEPFDPDNVNPNSYNFRLGNKIRIYDSDVLDPHDSNSFVELEIPADGYVLEPGRLYLAHTMERLGGTVYAPTFAARSSVARLGIFINLSASLGDVGFTGQWTLQLFTSHRVRVYPGMAIGQMMWWRMQGDRFLYEGKYQNSRGVRSSDIHVDFARKRNRAMLPRLSQSPVRVEVGGKFASLAEVASAFRVPPAFCVPVPVLRDSTDPLVMQAIAGEMADIKATVGAFLPASCARIAATAATLTLSDHARQMINEALDDISGGADAEAGGAALFAVRSSGIEEDGTELSLAGVHASILNVPADGVPAAVEQVWRSHYEPPAVVSRVRNGEFGAELRLAVVVQRMVTPEAAGVAFGQLADSGAVAVTAEWADGLADELLAGAVQGHHLDDPGTGAGNWPDALREVPVAVRALRGHYGYDVDVEWAVNGSGFHLLQVRPVTAATVPSRQRAEPVLRAIGLYDESPPPGFDLGEVGQVYVYYVTKRGPAHQLARSSGFRSGDGIVLRFNQAGLAPSEGEADVLGRFLSGHDGDFVLDCGETARQLICRRAEVRGQLGLLASSFPDGTVCTAIVRPFVRGTGVITAAADGGILAEVAPGGLIELNRGTGAASQVFLADDGTVRADEGVPETARAALTAARADLRKVTDAMRDRFGASTLEWAVADEQLLFLDYSAVAGNDAPTSGSTISPGVARGPVLDLTGFDEVLARLSIGPAVSIDKSVDVLDHEDLAKIVTRVRSFAEKPVVICSFPYAVLSVLLDDAAGFVFSRGSALCHLAILLREAGVPAVLCEPPAGDHLLIADGNVASL